MILVGNKSLYLLAIGPLPGTDAILQGCRATPNTVIYRMTKLRGIMGLMLFKLYYFAGYLKTLECTPIRFYCQKRIFCKRRMPGEGLPDEPEQKLLMIIGMGLDRAPFEFQKLVLVMACGNPHDPPCSACWRPWAGVQRQCCELQVSG